MIKQIGAAFAGLALLIALTVAAAGGAFSTLFGGSGSEPSQQALADIPPGYLTLYTRAAPTCPGLDWSVLAAIGKIESDHGRSTLPGVHSGSNSAGAQGPMQFLPATFKSVTAKANMSGGHKRTPSPYNPQDAIYAAAAYLCSSGARNHADLRRAIYAYNRANWYVVDVLTQAEQYRAQATAVAEPNSPAALKAINYAEGQLGLPYVWSGDGPSDGGFDCSGLTKAAYAAAGITLPRTANAQFRAGPRVPGGQALRPGDLVFYGNPRGSIHHVGIFIGGNQMIDAPGRGKKIRIEPYRFRGDDYAGGVRPLSDTAATTDAPPRVSPVTGRTS